MKLTKAQNKIVEDAKVKGYIIEFHNWCVEIYKKKENSALIAKGIRIYDDGTAHRLDVELGSANVIRTQKVMRYILGI